MGPLWDYATIGTTLGLWDHLGTMGPLWESWDHCETMRLCEHSGAMGPLSVYGTTVGLSALAVLGLRDQWGHSGTMGPVWDYEAMRPRPLWDHGTIGTIVGL